MAPDHACRGAKYFVFQILLKFGIHALAFGKIALIAKTCWRPQRRSQSRSINPSQPILQPRFVLACFCKGMPNPRSATTGGPALHGDVRTTEGCSHLFYTACLTRHFAWHIFLSDKDTTVWVFARARGNDATLPRGKRLPKVQFLYLLERYLVVSLGRSQHFYTLNSVAINYEQI